MTKRQINLIVACSREGGIAHRDVIPFRNGADIAHFWTSIGQDPVIVGRKTWQAHKKLFLKYRPNAQHIVISSSKMHWPEYHASSKKEALKMVEGDVVWICGGASIYDLFIDDVDTAYVSLFFKHKEKCDTRFNFDRLTSKLNLIEGKPLPSHEGDDDCLLLELHKNKWL